MPSKVTENICMVGSGELSGFDDCCVYAIRLESGDTCLVDAGTSHAEAIIRNLQKATFDGPISHLIITHAHYDHIGAAWQFKEKYDGLEIIAHELDADAIQGVAGTERRTAASWYSATYTPVNVDIIIHSPVEEMTLGGTNVAIYHAPGHTPGSIVATVIDEGKTVLFGQDIHGPFMPEFKSSINDWAKSMEHLIELDADILCEGHFGVIHGKEKVKKFITSYLEQNGF